MRGSRRPALAAPLSREVTSSTQARVIPISRDDHEPVRHARSGDAGAFEELVRRHAGATYRLLVRLLGDPTAAEDVAQETFIGAWQSLSRFRSEAKLSTWLFRIAMNKSSNHMSRERRRRTVPLDEIVDRVPDLDAETFQVVEAGLAQETTLRGGVPSTATRLARRFAPGAARSMSSVG
jgi:RNA polymerase sigma factor (sigma-70 family)